MKQRIIDRIDREIPPSQAAYRAGRSTTERVFAMKILAEKAITSQEYTIFLLMLDMSKAFDTVNRKLLIEDLSKIINRDELHIISIMLQVELSVKCGSSTSAFFKTDTGVPQGGGLSANQFTLYLANTLKNIQRNENDYAIQQPLTLTQIMSEHCYTKPINDEINIDQEYADDMSSITTNPTIIEYKKKIRTCKTQN